MNTKLISAAALTATTLALPLSGHAGVVAQDNASNSAYSGGYASGQNGGTGFTPFAVTATNAAGTFVYTASESEGNSGTPAPGSIDTPNSVAGSSPLSFGLYAQGGGKNPTGTSVTISRGFAAPLITGGSFSLDFVKGYNDGGTAGVQLSTAADTTGTLLYNGGNGVLSFNGTDTTNGFKSGADHLIYTLTSPTTYTFTLSGADSYSGSGTSTGPITGFQIKQTDSGSTATDHNAYFNNLLVTAPAVPEASSSIGLGLMLALGGLVLVAKKRSAKA